MAHETNGDSPSTMEEIEALLRAKIASGHADTGLYDTGLKYVVVDTVSNGKNDELTFTWFETLRTIDDVLCQN